MGFSVLAVVCLHERAGNGIECSMRFFSNTQEDNEILCFLDGIRTVAVVVILIVTTVVITLLPRKRIRAIRRAVAV